MSTPLSSIPILRISFAGFVSAIVLIAVAATVRAHSFPEEETPSAGQTLSTPPAAVSIKFDAPIEHLFAKLEVEGPDGKNCAAGNPAFGDDTRTLAVKLGPLAPGVYTVKWAVVGIDTHHTNGSYIFTVKGSGA
ncbi:MAG: copper resistance CopC family protein [Candidatus Binataceae bacterium]